MTIDWRALTELERRILSELEEAGEEDVATLMVTVFPPTGTPDELAQMQDALRSLMAKRLIKIAMHSMPNGRVLLNEVDGLAEVDALSGNMSFDADALYWGDRREIGPPYFQVPLPEVVATEMGEKLGWQILDEFGYQWWRQPTT